MSGKAGWLCIGLSLVLLMTAPGLAMFYGGLVRKKNVLSVMMQCLFLMALMTVIWALYGYSLAFGEADGALKPYIGDGDYVLMHGVARSWDKTAVDDDPPHGQVVEPMAAAIPRLTN